MTSLLLPCRSDHAPGRHFLYALCVHRHLALVQTSNHTHANIDRTKMHVRPYRPFAEALMRTLVQHFYAEYQQAIATAAGQYCLLCGAS